MILSLVILNDQFLVRPILTRLQKAAGCSFNFRHWMLFYRGIAMILTEMRLQSQYAKARRRAFAYQNQLEAEERRAAYERRQKAAKDAKAAALAAKASKVRPPKPYGGHHPHNNNHRGRNGRQVMFEF